MCIESKRLQLNFVVMLVLHCNKRFYSHSIEVLVLSLVVDLMQLLGCRRSSWFILEPFTANSLILTQDECYLPFLKF